METRMAEQKEELEVRATEDEPQEGYDLAIYL